MDILLFSVLRLYIPIILFLYFAFDSVFWALFWRILIYNVIVGFLKLFRGFRRWLSWEHYLSYYVLYWIWQSKLNRFMEDKFVWIRRECRLLRAVHDDMSRASKAGHQKQMESSQASQVLAGSDHNQELKESLLSWVKKTRKVIEKAKPFISTYQARRRNFSSRHLLLLQISQVYSIWWNLPKKDDFQVVKRFYESPEKSRSKFRSLQLQDIDVEGESESTATSAELQVVGPVRNLVSSVLERVPQEAKNMKEFWLKMILLEGFLKDLEDVELESAIEKAWIKEVEAIMGDVDHAMETFKQRKEQKTRWLRRFYFDCFLADSLLSDEVKSLAKRVAELFEAKEIYGFQFGRRQVQSHPYHKDLDDFQGRIQSLIDEVRGKSEGGQVATNDRDDICGKLENMQKLLKKMKVFEGASKFRSACLEQMNIIKCEAEKSFRKYLEDRNGRMNTGPIENAVDDFKRSINAYNKVRRKSSSIIGLEEDTEKLVTWLNDGKGYIYSIVGMQGIGKTTLAKKVYQHEAISNSFCVRRWVSVPEGSNDDNALLKNVSGQIIEPPGAAADEVRGKEYWVQNIHNFLKDKRYLIVLDNISTNRVWGILKDAFPARCEGSKILLTTRGKTLELHAAENTNNHPHQLELPLRSKEESWDLFKEKMHFVPEDERMRKVKDIVVRCDGLPLTISNLGFLMSEKNLNDQELGEIMDQHNNLWSKHIENISLPEHLRHLVTYCTLFHPRLFEIPVRRLIGFWIAEELVQKSDDEEVEQIAMKYLWELIGLNLIQPVKRNVDGELKTCRLPSAMYQRVADDSSNFGHFGDGRTCKRDLQSEDVLLFKSKSRSERPADRHDRKDDNFKLIHCAGTVSRDRELLTFISFDTRNGDEPGKNITDVLSRGIPNGSFRKLKVLDLERVFRPHLPGCVGDLTKLRYLGLRWTYLEKIPETIGKLRRLQTLDLKHTYIRTLPSTIWYLEDLRHLYLNNAYWTKFGSSTKIRSLQNLQTLWGVFLDRENPLKDSLQELKCLRRLELVFHLDTNQQEDLLKKVAKLNHLQTLRLRSIWRPRSIDVGGKTQELCSVDLSQLHNLSNLYLFGKLKTTMPSIPNSLLDLTLSASELREDPMQVLKGLTNLRSLCLFANSFSGESMESCKECFPKLLVLKLWKLGGLKTWNIREKAMENLKELEIRSCQHLEVPSGLKHLKSLREVKLRNMRHEFEESLVLNKVPIWDNISSMPAIIITDSRPE